MTLVKYPSVSLSGQWIHTDFLIHFYQIKQAYHGIAYGRLWLCPKKYLYDPEPSSSIKLPVLLHFYLLEIQFLCLWSVMLPLLHNDELKWVVPASLFCFQT